MDEAYWINYALEWASIGLGLGVASPLLISAYVILKNDGKTDVKLKG